MAKPKYPVGSKVTTTSVYEPGHGALHTVTGPEGTEASLSCGGEEGKPFDVDPATAETAAQQYRAASHTASSDQATKVVVESCPADKATLIPNEGAFELECKVKMDVQDYSVAAPTNPTPIQSLCPPPAPPARKR